MSKTWIDWFLSTSRGRYFIKVDIEYIKDPFNLYDLRKMISIDTTKYKYAREAILGNMLPPNHRPREWPADIDKYAEMVYGTIHARYLHDDSGP